MTRCGDCLHFRNCSHYVTPEETFPEVGGCSAFKNKGDFVEVVRCKDCKNWCHEEIAKRYGADRYCTRTGFPVAEDDFCSYGERKE